MANVHYGKIGDVWKHLPLAEILSIEKPNIYWESHAGSAQYPLAHCADRDYGVFYFLTHAEESGVLRDSAYYGLLRRYVKDRQLMAYPGSPCIAMSLLSTHGEKYLFCDTDENSLENILKTSKEFGIPRKIVKAKKADGVSAVYEALSELDDKDVSRTVIYIDPYEPFEMGENGLTSVDLFCRASERGVKTIIWYGFGSIDDHPVLLEYSMQAFKKNRFDPVAHNLWLGQIQLTGLTKGHSNYNPGVFGCGIICSNLSDKSLAACLQLGKGLEQIYKSALLPDGNSGSIEFTQNNL